MAMDLGLNGKVALVLAASDGIGKATALRLAGEGASVVVVGRDPAKLKAVEEAGKGAIFGIARDLTDAGAEEIVDQALAKFGRLDICVLNTGGPTIQPFLETRIEQWDGAYQLLFRPVVAVAMAAARHMAERGSGALLFITSSWTKQPAPGSCLSMSFRAGLSALSKLLSIELAPSGVRVNQVMPGTTATNRMTGMIDNRAARNGTTPEQELALSYGAIPLARWAKPEEIADAILFLVSDRASYVTGQTLVVDGGSIKSVF
ncbi:MAG: SDR family oxidoreductase [Sphingomonadales bacterium]|nr:MAG: SDR family oxidoreductase [Sphingomonadales bacterium]TNF05616.1 MAG: SDR family oxidoreductase [Sphingomonadales bacterium]